jgi:fructose-bisphosphate aldolase class 1
MRFKGAARHGRDDQGLENELSDEVEDYMSMLIHTKGWVEKMTIGPVIAPAAKSADNATVIGHLERDIGLAETAGLVESASTEQLRSLLRDAEASANDDASLLKAALGLASLSGIDDGYRGSLVITLQMLARPHS